MKNKLLNIHFVITCFLFLFLPSCASLFGPAAPPPEKYHPVFDFKPTEVQEVGSAKINIALLNPVFADLGSESSFTLAPYTLFADNMGNDFEELLTNKGFTIRGPLKSIDELVYREIKSVDVVLEVEISLETEGQLQLQRFGYDGQYTRSYNKVSGTFYHFGSLNMTATSTSGVKYWKKSISLPRKAVVCTGHKRFYGNPTSSQVLTDVGVYNPIAKALEEYYQEALSSVNRHIDTEEFKEIAKEIKESE